MPVPRVLAATAVMLAGVLSSSLGAQERQSLASGHPVTYAPRPNYRLTAKGDTDHLDLTDGRLSERPGQAMWFESHCVGFSYAGLQELAVDLGSVQPIDEVAIRFQGGSPQAGICTPGWIDVLVSADGNQYFTVASYSRWEPSDSEAYNVPRNEGKAWIHTFRFRGLDTAGRYVGVSFYGAGLSVSDEMWVYAGEHAVDSARSEGRPPANFSVARPHPYFHKPVVFFSTDIATPNTVGLIAPPDAKPCEVTVDLDLPPGMVLSAGTLGGVELAETAPTEVDEGGTHWTRRTFATTVKASTKTWGRIYLGGDWSPGRQGVLRFRMRGEDWARPWAMQPVRAVHIDPAPQPKQLVTGLAWWSLPATRAWPDSLAAFRHLGFNTVPVSARWLDGQLGEEGWAFLAVCRETGFRIMNIDSPFHHMIHKNKGRKEIYAQFEDGTFGAQLCPSYRGELYRAELERIAEQTARCGASFLSCDIELWNWRGPLDCERCTRCQADFAGSGIDDWAEWRLRKGEEIWRDLAAAVRRAAADHAAAGGEPVRDVEIGGYDFRPGKAYQHIWPLDRLYPDSMANSQVSIYTPLHPYHLELIGDEVRADREKLPKSDVLPWLTPGDAGTFPGEMFTYALLECFANGARGLHFWSGRVWDTETLQAYARAIRIVAPVERVIVEGELLGEVRAEPEVRVSGMRLDSEAFLLVADYHLRGEKTVVVTLPVEQPLTVVDLGRGTKVGRLRPDAPSFETMLGPARARVLHVLPEPR